MKKKVLFLISALAISIAPTSFLTSCSNERISTNQVNSLKIDGEKILTMNVGETYTLKVEISATQTEYEALTFESSNSDVCSVDNNGVISAKKAGFATILVKSTYDSSKYDYATIEVKENEIELSSIEIDSALSLVVGETKTIEIKVTPADYNKEDIEFSFFDNESGYEDIILLAKDGTVYAKSVGEVKIVAKSKDGSITSNTLTLNVTEKVVALESITIDSEYSGKVDDVIEISYTLSPSNTTQTDIKLEFVEEEGKNSSEYATLSSTHVLLLKAGSVKVRYVSTANNTIVSNVATITIVGTPVEESIPLESIKINDEFNGKVNDVISISYTLAPENTTETGVRLEFVEQDGVDSSTLASISGNKVTLLKAGTVKVRYVSTTNNKIVSNVATIYISEATGETIPLENITIADAFSGNVGDTIEIPYSLSPSNTTETGVKLEVVEEDTSDSSSYVSINGNKMTLLKEGTIKVRYVSTSNSAIASNIATITITENEEKIPLESIKISNTSFSGYVGDVIQINYSLSPSNTTEKAVNLEFVDEDGANYASIEQDADSGKYSVTLKEVGSVNVRFASTINSSIVSDVATIVVKKEESEDPSDTATLKEELLTKIEAARTEEIDGLNAVDYYNFEYEDDEYSPLTIQELSYDVYSGPHLIVDKKDYSYGSMSESYEYYGFDKEKTGFYDLSLASDGSSASYNKYDASSYTDSDVLLYNISGTAIDDEYKGATGSLNEFFEENQFDNLFGSNSTYKIKKNGTNYVVSGYYVKNEFSWTSYEYENIYFEFNLTIQFDENKLSKYTYVENKYAEDDFDLTSGSHYDGKCSAKTKNVILNASYGTRSDDYGYGNISLDSLFTKSISYDFKDYEGNVIDDINNYSPETGQSISLDVKSYTPSYASSTDQVELEIVSGDDVASVSYDGKTLNFNSAGTVTFKIKAINGTYESDTFTLNIKKATPKSIKFGYGAKTSLYVGDTCDYSCEVDPSNVEQNYEISIKSGDEFATLEKNLYGSYTLTGIKEGEVTLLAKSLEDESITCELVVTINGALNEEKFEAFFDKGTYVDSNNESSTITIDKEANKLSFSIVVSDETTTFSVNYVVSDGNVTFTKNDDFSSTNEDYNWSHRKSYVNYSVAGNYFTILIYDGIYEYASRFSFDYVANS